MSLSNFLTSRPLVSLRPVPKMGSEPGRKSSMGASPVEVNNPPLSKVPVGDIVRKPSTGASPVELNNPPLPPRPDRLLSDSDVEARSPVLSATVAEPTKNLLHANTNTISHNALSAALHVATVPQAGGYMPAAQPDVVLQTNFSSQPATSLPHTNALQSASIGQSVHGRVSHVAQVINTNQPIAGKPLTAAPATAQVLSSRQSVVGKPPPVSQVIIN